MTDRSRSFDYDVCLSFAGEDRTYVDEVASGIRANGLRVFYDRYEEVALWGKDLYSHLDYIYSRAARYCVLFVSDHYRRKVWTNHERESAQARALDENREYLLPARFDDTEVPGLRRTIGFIDLRSTSSSEFVELIVKKVGPTARENFFPENPDKLFDALDATEPNDRERVLFHAHGIMRALTRMDKDERSVLTTLLASGCPVELPDNMHMKVDLLRRLTGRPPTECVELLKGMKSLGVYTDLREDADRHDGDTVVVVQWLNLSVPDLDAEGHPLVDDLNATPVAIEMIKLSGDRLCAKHAAESLDHLNFSQLSTRTFVTDDHSLRQKAQRQHALAARGGRSNDPSRRRRAKSQSNVSRKKKRRGR